MDTSAVLDVASRKCHIELIVDCPHRFIDVAGTLADIAAGVQLRHFGRRLSTSLKSDGTYATSADLEAERLMRVVLQAEFPDHGIIGEEFPPVPAKSEFTWIIDPLDGTESFLAGMPLFGTLVALKWNNHFILGVIDHAVLKDRWVGADGRGTSRNGAPVLTRACSSLQDSVVAVAKPDTHSPGRWQSVAGSVRYCDDCHAYGLLASGLIDAVIDSDLDVCDYAALEPIVRNAGGLLTTWTGLALGARSNERIVAVGDPSLHKTVLVELAASTAR